MPSGSSLKAAFLALPAPMRGVLWMVVACVFFSIMLAIIRLVSVELHGFEIAFFRNLFALVVMLPWLVRMGLGALSTGKQRLYIIRCVIGLGAMLSNFWAITQMPLAQAVSLSFTSPIFATILAALMLGETVRLRRWAAVIVGFIGVLIIVRPGVQEVSFAAVVMLLSAFLQSLSAITIKQLARTEPPSAIVIYMVIYMTPMSLPPALLVWETPSLWAFAWLLALGVVATLAHQAYTRSIAVADASLVLPFDFTRLIFVSVLAYAIFDEVPDTWTFVGAALILASAVYIAHREARIARSARAATDAAGPRH